jgi:hypothetical protein
MVWEFQLNKSRKHELQEPSGFSKDVPDVRVLR